MVTYSIPSRRFQWGESTLERIGFVPRKNDGLRLLTWETPQGNLKNARNLGARPGPVTAAEVRSLKDDAALI
jgi:hypothetical protein